MTLKTPGYQITNKQYKIIKHLMICSKNLLCQVQLLMDRQGKQQCQVFCMEMEINKDKMNKKSSKADQ